MKNDASKKSCEYFTYQTYYFNFNKENNIYPDKQCFFPCLPMPPYNVVELVPQACHGHA